MVLGLDAFHSGDWTRALDLLRKAGAEAPDICALHYYVSLCHKRLGDDIQRYAALERALECDSKSESAMIELGNYHLERGEFAEATARYKACLESPRVADLARWNLAVAYMRNDDVLAAKEALEGVRSTSPYAHSARVWSHRLNELSTSLDASGAAKRVNLLKRIGLPDVEIAIPVLLVGLGLLVSFLIPGLKTSAIDSSKVETKKGRARLRDVGLGMLAIGVVLLLPIVSTRVSSPLAALPELEASNQGLLEFLTPAMDN